MATAAFLLIGDIESARAHEARTAARTPAAAVACTLVAERERLQMVLRRDVSTAAQMLYAAPGGPIPPENDMRTAQAGLDCGDGGRSSEIASDGCAARVADVLNRLGYGFCAIPYGSSAPKRARARLSARAAMS